MAIAALGQAAVALEPVGDSPPSQVAPRGCTNVSRLSAEASATRCIRMRPMARPRTSAAMTTSAFFPRCRRPPPASSPPTRVSSTSTSSDTRSRPGRTIARRSLCSHVHRRAVAAQAEHAL